MLAEPAAEPGRLTEFSRENPSPRYLELVGLYQRMHQEGDTAHDIAAENTFDGRSLLPCCREIRELVRRYRAKTILDYGAGKGKQYGKIQVNDGKTVYGSVQKFWGVREITCYDPGNQAFDILPDGPFGGVICTDVLEHCPEQDLDWILHEIFSRAEKFVYCTVALYPAAKMLPNGENAHCTLMPVPWWQELFAAVAAHYPGLPYTVSCEPCSRTKGDDAANPPIVFQGAG